MVYPIYACEEHNLAYPKGTFHILFCVKGNPLSHENATWLIVDDFYLGVFHIFLLFIFYLLNNTIKRGFILYFWLVGFTHISSSVNFWYFSKLIVKMSCHLPKLKSSNGSCLTTLISIIIQEIYKSQCCIQHSWSWTWCLSKKHEKYFLLPVTYEN